MKQITRDRIKEATRKWFEGDLQEALRLAADATDGEPDSKTAWGIHEKILKDYHARNETPGWKKMEVGK